MVDATDQTAFSHPAAGALAPLPVRPGADAALPWSLALLVEAILRWRWVALLGTLAGGVAVAACWYLMPPLYEAEARLILERGRQSAELDSGRVKFDPLGSYEYDLLNTQRDTILSRTILSEALAHSEIAQTYAQERDPETAFQRRLDVSTSRESWSLILRLRDPQRERAESGLAALIDAYLRQRRQIDDNAAAGAVGRLREEVTDSNRRLQSSREAEESFRRANDVLIMDAEKSLPAQRLATLSSKRVVIGEQIAALTQLVAQLSAAPHERGEPRLQAMLAIEYIARNQTVSEQYAQLLALITRRSELAVKYLERHPRSIEIEAQVDAKRQQVATVVEQVVDGVLGDQRKLIAQAEALDGEIQTQRDALADYRDKVMRLQVISLQSRAFEEHVAVIQRRLGEEQVSARMAQPQMVQVGKPASSALAINRRSLPIAGSAVLGALAGLLLVVLLCEQLNRTVRDAAGARRSVRRELLGEAPWAPGDGRIPEVAIAAAYAAIRARLLLAMPVADQGLVVLVSSPTASDGRTQVCAQLAISLANAGLRTLLVAGDLRQAGIARYLASAEGPGFAELLRGEPVEPNLTEHPCLQVLGPGGVQGNPGELLHSRHLPVWAAQARGHWDVILIDSPPLALAADALLLASIADAILPVVRSGHTSLRGLRDWTTQFERYGAAVLGALLLTSTPPPATVGALPAAALLAWSLLPVLLLGQLGAEESPAADRLPEILVASYNRAGGRDLTTLGGRSFGRTVAEPAGGYRILDRTGLMVGRVAPNADGGTDEFDAGGRLVLRSLPDHAGGRIILTPDGSLRGRLVPNYHGGVDWYDAAGTCLGRSTYGQDLVFNLAGGG